MGNVRFDTKSKLLISGLSLAGFFALGFGIGLLLNKKLEATLIGSGVGFLFVSILLLKIKVSEIENQP